jgi:ABC-2 type transport system ATP-binding protein
MGIIEVRELVKKFKKITAVDGISFDVPEGELFGLLGPNGAGKTTTISMLTTLLQPTSGRVTVAGFDVCRQKEEVRESIGLVFQNVALDLYMTGRENLEFHAWMYDMPGKLMREKIKEILELVELSDRADELVLNYSGGMRRRLEIARGLMHRPKILFLDEPTLGLDTQTRRRIWEYIQKLNKYNKMTIILTTHYMDEADFLCERVGIIDRGKIVAMDSPAKLKEVIGSDIITLETDSGDCSLFGQLGFVKSCGQNTGAFTINVEDGEGKIPAIMEFASAHSIKIRRVGIKKPSLEDVFIKFTGASMREDKEKKEGG